LFWLKFWKVRKFASRPVFLIGRPRFLPERKTIWLRRGLQRSRTRSGAYEGMLKPPNWEAMAPIK
jgi:hypothetical protein